jgi:hypothetical protein
MSCLILVAGQTRSICFTWAGLNVVENELGFSRLAVFRARSMAGFARLPLPSPSFVVFDDSMAALQKSLAHIFMANQTSFGSGIPFFVGASLFGGRTGNEGQ